MNVKNEMGVVVYFAQNCHRAGLSIIEVQVAFPDAIIRDRNGIDYRAEFEYKASSFVYHDHDPMSCDVVVCWVNDWIGATIPILDLSQNRWFEKTLTVMGAHERKMVYLEAENRRLSDIIRKAHLNPHPKDIDVLEDKEFLSEFCKRGDENGFSSREFFSSGFCSMAAYKRAARTLVSIGVLKQSERGRTRFVHGIDIHKALVLIGAM